MVCFGFFLGLLPGIIWFWFIYKSDKFEPEPLGKIIFVFLGGFISVFPAILMELGAVAVLGLSGDIDSIYEAAGSAWLIAGLIEEIVKFCVVLFIIFFSKEFDEPVDGIVYSSAAAIGFASLENYLYILQYYKESGFGLIAARAFLATPGHIAFSAMWGYALGRGKFHPKIARRLAVSGLLLAAGTHGLYNFLLMSGGLLPSPAGYFLAICVMLLVVSLWIVLVRHVRKSRSVSPYNPQHEQDELDKFDDNQMMAKG